VRGRLGGVAENFLDATHTINGSSGMLRGQIASPAKVVVAGRPGQVEVTTEAKAKAGRHHRRMFEGTRSSTVGRFRGPNIADVEFHGPAGIRIAITSYLTPTQAGKVGGFAIITAPGNPWLGRLKFAALKPSRPC